LSERDLGRFYTLSARDLETNSLNQTEGQINAVAPRRNDPRLYLPGCPIRQPRSRRMEHIISALSTADSSTHSARFGHQPLIH
jgi:hypothetical protein